MKTFDGASSRSSLSEYIVVLTVCITAAAGGAVCLGQDANWDQRNYHLYTVHAWLTGRMSVDLAPSQIQTWLNPLSQLPGYLLIRHARPVLAGLAMGAMAGVNGLLVWILVRRLQEHTRSWMNLACAGLATVCGLTGSVFVSNLGTTFSENLCSPLVLAALISLTGRHGGLGEGDTRRFLVAGCCLGAACGLKLTHLSYALGMSASLLVLWPFCRFRLTSLMTYAIGLLAGLVAVGGYWATKLWLAFGNPMFPFFNGFFRSPLFDAVNFADTRFLPASFATAALTYPFSWLVLGIHPTSEVPFREPRFALVAAFLPLTMIVSGLRSADRATSDATGRVTRLRDFWLCSVFFIVSYAIWLKQFGIQRYALSLELLTGVLLLLSFERLLRSAREVSVVLGLFTLAAILWTRPHDWHRVRYGPDWYGFAIAEGESPTLYVMTSWHPTAYVIPYLSSANRFVRLGGNMPLEPQMPLGQRALSIIRGHAGPIRSLSAVEVDGPERARLQRFGLDLLPDSCQSFQSTMDTFWTCGLVKCPPTRAAQ